MERLKSAADRVMRRALHRSDGRSPLHLMGAVGSAQRTDNNGISGERKRSATQNSTPWRREQSVRQQSDNLVGSRSIVVFALQEDLSTELREMDTVLVSYV